MGSEESVGGGMGMGMGMARPSEATENAMAAEARALEQRVAQAQTLGLGARARKLWRCEDSVDWAAAELAAKGLACAQGARTASVWALGWIASLPLGLALGAAVACGAAHAVALGTGGVFEPANSDIATLVAAMGFLGAISVDKSTRASLFFETFPAGRPSAIALGCAGSAAAAWLGGADAALSLFWAALGRASWMALAILCAAGALLVVENAASRRVAAHSKRWMEALMAAGGDGSVWRAIDYPKPMLELHVWRVGNKTGSPWVPKLGWAERSCEALEWLVARVPAVGKRVGTRFGRDHKDAWPSDEEVAIRLAPRAMAAMMEAAAISGELRVPPDACARPSTARRL